MATISVNDNPLSRGNTIFPLFEHGGGKAVARRCGRQIVQQLQDAIGPILEDPIE